MHEASATEVLDRHEVAALELGAVDGERVDLVGAVDRAARSRAACAGDVRARTTITVA